MGFIKGEDRNQCLLFPEVLDDYVGEDNPVRFIDEFVSSLDLVDMGFKHATPEATGRPPYDPGDLLKLYIYGYVNKIRSSRRLERETRRNLELMWLLRKLRPDHKTIATFRSENSEALKKVWRRFTLMCREMQLFGGELIGVDGSKFRAVNSKKRNYTLQKLRGLIREIDARIEAYLRELNESDEGEGEVVELTADELKEKIERLRELNGDYREKERKLEEAGETQISLTDPDSRLMKSPEGSQVCYNVQIAVDSKHKLIVECDVTNERADQGQLARMAKRAKEQLGVDELEAVADKGYYSGEQVSECEQSGIIPYIEKPVSRNRDGLFGREQFIYDANRDVYVCPAGEELKYRCIERRERRRVYRTTACEGCHLREQCTTSKIGRAIKRNLSEEALERMSLRVANAPEKIRMRKGLVEHPFGTIKRWWGQGHFLVKGKRKANGEMSLIAMAYNLTRAINLVGVGGMRQALPKT